MFNTIAANVILHSKTEQLCSTESMELRSQRFIRLNHLSSKGTIP
jgi:hypothetical protein